jgi:lysophospholipase L1-like esterase
MKKALHFTGDKPERVIVLSIPDWSVTPFAQHRDTQKIAKEIELFNAINKEVAAHYRTAYIDVTSGSRETLKNPAMLTADKLHPAAAEYKRWAVAVVAEIEKQL